MRYYIRRHLVNSFNKKDCFNCDKLNRFKEWFDTNLLKLIINLYNRKYMKKMQTVYMVKPKIKLAETWVFLSIYRFIDIGIALDEYMVKFIR